MGRPNRVALGGYVYHVLNRANGRWPICQKDGDYLAFVKILGEVLDHVPSMRLLAYCLRPNHWHLVVWPQQDGDLSDFGHWLTLTNTQRWHAHYHNVGTGHLWLTLTHTQRCHAHYHDVGTGHLYQGRFKSFPIEEDDHFLQVCRKVERIVLRAGLANRAERWPWGSLWARSQKEKPEKWILRDWTVAEPVGWVNRFNQPQSQAELEAVRRSVRRGRPYGGEE